MVFSTIAENVRSFFQKEEALEKEPKKVLDAAVELYERPISKEHAIVQASIPPERQDSAPSLPVSSEQLRNRLNQPSAASSQSFSSMNPSSRSASSQQSSSSSELSIDDISSQIAEFEAAMDVIPGGETHHSAETSSSSPSQRDSSPVQHRPSYFNKLASRIREEGYDVALKDNPLSGMKAHHERHSVEAVHRAKGADLEASLSHKLTELQMLEREWASRQDEISAGEERVEQLEGLIGERTKELQELVGRLKEHAATLPATAMAPEQRSSEPSSLEQLELAVGAASHPAPLLPSSPEDVVTSPDSIRPPAAVTSSAAASQTDARQPSMSAPPLAPSHPSDSSLSARAPSDAGSFSGPVAASSPEDRCFILHDGRRLSTMGDLRSALLAMDDATFHHHVTPERNDFATWLADVFGENALAEKALHARSKYDLAQLLAR